jgi:hypothetical protein
LNNKEPKPQSPDISVKEVSILGQPGPFQVIEDADENELANPSEAPKRIYDCVNYESCLELAAALNWDSFTCSGCSQQINNNLVWRAHQAKRHDAVALSLCSHLPEIGVHSSKTGTTTSDIPETSDKPQLPPTGKSILA